MAVLLLESISHHTVLESYLIFFGLVASPMIEQQQPSFRKFSLNLIRFQKFVAEIFLYTILGSRSKRKFKTRAQMKDIKQKHLRTYS